LLLLGYVSFLTGGGDRGMTQSDRNPKIDSKLKVKLKILFLFCTTSFGINNCHGSDETGICNNSDNHLCGCDGIKSEKKCLDPAVYESCHHGGTGSHCSYMLLKSTYYQCRWKNGDCVRDGKCKKIN